MISQNIKGKIERNEQLYHWLFCCQKSNAYLEIENDRNVWGWGLWCLTPLST